jgi:prepilin-type N-terminal cleavage/methylation domain-containing protein
MRFQARTATSGQARGFTLVEIAVVLVILAVLLASVLGPLATRLEAGERQKAQDELSEIKESIYGFALANGRLPCPDTDPTPDGDENRNAGGACVRADGTLPWRVLEAPPQDPWGNPYIYRVTLTFADNPPSGTGGTCTTPAVQSSFNLCDSGNIDVDDAGGALLATVPAVVLSAGKNENDPNLAVGGALSVHEAENSNGDATFVSKIFSRDAAQEFDDVVVWISPNVLKNRMVVGGRLP